MFMLHIEEQIQILNGNNNFFRVKYVDLVGNFHGRDYETNIVWSRDIMTPRLCIENIIIIVNQMIQQLRPQSAF